MNSVYAFLQKKKNEHAPFVINPKVAGQCGRCHMIGIDQDTGAKTREPLLSLSAHRTGKVSLNSCVFVMLIMLVSWQL